MDEEEMVVEVAADVGVLLVTQCSGCTPRKMEYWGGPLGALFPPAGHSPRAPSALRATLDSLLAFKPPSGNNFDKR
jgi:hypothetical protein